MTAAWPQTALARVRLDVAGHLPHRQLNWAAPQHPEGHWCARPPLPQGRGGAAWNQILPSFSHVQNSHLLFSSLTLLRLQGNDEQKKFRVFIFIQEKRSEKTPQNRPIGGGGAKKKIATESPQCIAESRLHGDSSRRTSQAGQGAGGESPDPE